MVKVFARFAREHVIVQGNALDQNLPTEYELGTIKNGKPCGVS